MKYCNHAQVSGRPFREGATCLLQMARLGAEFLSVCRPDRNGYLQPDGIAEMRRATQLRRFNQCASVLGSAPGQPFGSNRHLCYRDDGSSIFAIKFWPEEFAPCWAAYKFPPENYGSDDCRTQTRDGAKCYLSGQVAENSSDIRQEMGNGRLFR